MGVRIGSVIMASTVWTNHMNEAMKIAKMAPPADAKTASGYDYIIPPFGDRIALGQLHALIAIAESLNVIANRLEP